jgi:hypothetical protein
VTLSVKDDKKYEIIRERTQTAKIASSRSFLEKKRNGWTLQLLCVAVSRGAE